jgi:hypothetical protein
VEQYHHAQAAKVIQALVGEEEKDKKDDTAQKTQ